MSKKYGWVIHFPDEDMSYDEPYESEEDAFEAAEYALSCVSLGADMEHLSNPGDYPETGDNVDGEIEVFEI